MINGAVLSRAAAEAAGNVFVDIPLEVIRGQEAQFDVTLTNAGTDLPLSIVVDEYSLTSRSRFDFGLTNSCVFSLGREGWHIPVLSPNQSCHLRIITSTEQSGVFNEYVFVEAFPVANGFQCGFSGGCWTINLRLSVKPAPSMQISGSGEFGLLPLGNQSSRAIEILNAGDLGAVLEGDVSLLRIDTLSP
jgi:hypothetical protein